MARPWVHLFDARARPLRSLRVPDAFAGGKIAFDGRRIALLHGRELLLLAADGAPLGRATLSGELGEPYHVYFSPSGELWVFPRARAEMLRFAVPGG